MINKWNRFEFIRSGRYLEISYHELDDNKDKRFNFVGYCYAQFEQSVRRKFADNLIMMWESDLVKLLENQKDSKE